MRLTDFPMLGDNFRTVGPWRILQGQGWRRWQASALAAEIAAAEARGDMIAATRLKQELHARISQAAPPTRQIGAR